MSEVSARIEIRFVHELSAEDFTAMVARARAAVADTSRVGNVEVTVDGHVGGSDVLQPGSQLFRLLEGYFGVGKNGFTMFCTVNDPAESRVASATDEPNVGFRGTSRIRASDGKEELIVMELDKGWEVHRSLGRRNYFGVSQKWIRIPSLAPTNDDRQFALGTSLEPDGIHFHMPVWLHQHGVHGAVASKPVLLTAAVVRALTGAVGRRSYVQAAETPSGFFTSARDPDVLKMLKKMRAGAPRKTAAKKKTTKRKARR